MSYEKQNFTDGQVLEAEHLNKMEKGIEKANSIIVEVGGDTLTWDGNTEGRTMIDLGCGLGSYKVSDALLTAEDLVEGTSVSLSFDGEVHSDILANIQNITIMQAEPLMLALNGMPILMCIPEEQVAEVGIEEGGTFFTALVMGGYSNVHITSLTIPGYTGFGKEVLKPEILPEHNHKWENITDLPKLYFKSVTDGEYLYTDLTCTTKATMSDIPNHADLSLGHAPSGAVAAWYRPIRVANINPTDSSGFGEVMIMSGAQVIRLYTAEHTAT